MPTNCVNCGMPLNGNRCEYCGTNYGLLNTDVKPLTIYSTGIETDELKAAYKAIENHNAAFIRGLNGVELRVGKWRWNERGISCEG